MNPLPYGNENCGGCCDYIVPKGTHCDFKCPGCSAPTFAADGACPIDCAHYPGLPHGGCDSKFFTRQLDGIDSHEYAVENKIVIPLDIPPGEYVLGKQLQ